MENRIQYPLVVADGLDVFLFAGVSELEAELEGIDVAEGAYKAYDAEGRSLTLEAKGVSKGLFMVTPGRVRVAEAETEPTHQEELAALLRGHLRALGHSVRDSAPLAELLADCRKLHKHGG